MSKFELYEHVRIKAVPRGRGFADEFAIIQHIYEDGRIWISNLNMPYSGSTSEVVTEDKIEKV